ncbi:FGGY-family carbohydrate kinase [Glaciecola sp. SC05]|uniref:FGGY-family carbohydrate kinase n=1 Tax=Glaciecola sp. SC05 TaxID=1987355 RepID=UPI00352771B4
MTTDKAPHTLIIDIGKTHVKLHVLDRQFDSAFSKQMSNSVDVSSIYPSADVAKIWDWMLNTIKEVSRRFLVSRITITTHGATAALIDRDSSLKDGLVLPVLDYEFAPTFSDTPEYEYIRPEFVDSCSPSLPAGLNLGRQLYWLKKTFPAQFSQATDVLMYPQYWAWRFTGKRVSEITSLGCHTDLWSIRDQTYSALVAELNCQHLFPPIQPAWFSCGKLHPELSADLGLDSSCEFYSGLHDSNASFLRYRLAQDSLPFTVVSTGTWTILMASQVPLSTLDPKRDMLANVDALGTPIACARFMGGREFESICEQAGSWLGEQFEESHLQAIIDKSVFALPDFSDGSGPFGGRGSEFVGPVEKVSGIALATMYCALMIDYQLTMLQAQGKVIIEGAFLKNPLLCAVLNQLRAEQSVWLSRDATGTVLGAAYLTDWEKIKVDVELQPAEMSALRSLQAYRQQWLALLQQ